MKCRTMYALIALVWLVMMIQPIGLMMTLSTPIAITATLAVTAFRNARVRGGWRVAAIVAFGYSCLVTALFTAVCLFAFVGGR